MKLEEFDYELPEELIAQHPSPKRDESRLFVLHKNTGLYEHRHFYDIIDYLHEGDVLVRNNSKVIPARLYGTKEENEYEGFEELYLSKLIPANMAKEEKESNRIMLLRKETSEVSRSERIPSHSCLWDFHRASHL